MEKKEQCIKDKNHVVLYLQDHKTSHLPQPIYKTKQTAFSQLMDKEIYIDEFIK